jgi:hypothetical protein
VKKKLIILILIWLNVVVVTNTQAASQCTIGFPHYFVRSDGTIGLYLGMNGHWWYPCNIISDINGVDAQSCKTALAGYISAKLAKKPVTFRWDGTCEELAAPTQSITGRGFQWFGVYDL